MLTRGEIGYECFTAKEGAKEKDRKGQLGEEESSSKGRLGGWLESKASLEGFSPSLSFFLELLNFLPFRPKRAYKSPKNIEDLPRET